MQISRVVHRQSVALQAAKIILLDAGNSVHAADLCSRTDQLDTNVGTDFDDGVLVVCKLWRSSIGVELDVRRNEMRRNEERKGSSIGEEADLVD